MKNYTLAWILFILGMIMYVIELFKGPLFFQSFEAAVLFYVLLGACWIYLISEWGERKLDKEKQK